MCVVDSADTSAKLASRTIVVGDVHGCLLELERLLELCDIAACDRLIFVGDLVAKGPDSLGVIDFVMDRGAESVMGNHDFAVLAAHDGFLRKKQVPSWVGHEQRAIAQSLSVAQAGFLRGLPYSICLDSYSALVVHAGLDPKVPLARQSSNHLMNMRSIREDGTIGYRAGDGVPWASLWPGPNQVIFGHDAVRGLQRHPFAWGLDSGCVYGGRLSALILPDWKVVSVQAERVYSEPR